MILLFFVVICFGDVGATIAVVTTALATAMWVLDSNLHHLPFERGVRFDISNFSLQAFAV